MEEVFKKRLNKAAKESCKGNQHAMRYQPMLEQFKKGAEWAKNNSEWISVNDRLPDISMGCLVRTVRNDTEIAWYMQDDNCVNHFFPPRQTRKAVYSMDEQVTHWMPLPSPPST